MPVSDWITIGVIGATLVQLGYWIILFRRLAGYREVSTSRIEVDEKEPPSVSVIICVRNEEENVAKYLPHILNQKYRSFEVVVVNDNSTDETWFRLLDFQKKYSNLTLLNVPFATPPGKKAALAFGIRQARHDFLLLTDADCVPSSPYWIQEMQRCMGQKEIVLGYSPYQKRKGLLNMFIRFEAVYTAVQYFSFALAGHPYMGVGRNLMYRRKLFEGADGFSGHSDMASGDDDLFVNAVADRQNTAVCLSPDAFMYSRPKETWKGYYNQKIRHFSTGTRYRLYHQVLLGGLALSHFAHIAGVAAGYFFEKNYLLIIVLYMVRAVVVAGVYLSVLKRFRDETLWPWVLCMDILFPVYYALFAPGLLLGNRAIWRA